MQEKVKNTGGDLTPPQLSLYDFSLHNLFVKLLTFKKCNEALAGVAQLVGVTVIL